MISIVCCNMAVFPVLFSVLVVLLVLCSSLPIKNDRQLNPRGIFLTKERAHRVLQRVRRSSHNRPTRRNFHEECDRKGCTVKELEGIKDSYREECFHEGCHDEEIEEIGLPKQFVPEGKRKHPPHCGYWCRLRRRRGMRFMAGW